jgi:hypothetical protein
VHGGEREAIMEILIMLAAFVAMGACIALTNFIVWRHREQERRRRAYDQ